MPETFISKELDEAVVTGLWLIGNILLLLIDKHLVEKNLL